jgi:hypothetical protein
MFAGSKRLVGCQHPLAILVGFACSQRLGFVLKQDCPAGFALPSCDKHSVLIGRNNVKTWRENR